MGILRTDRITGLGGANAIKGSVFFNRQPSSFLRTDIDDTNYVLGTDDFTLELWHNTPTLETTNGLIMFGPGGYGYYNSFFHFSGADVQMYISSNGSSWDIASGTKIGERVINTWQHYALTREGNTFRGFIDGVLGATFTSSGAIRQGSSEFNKNSIMIGHRISTTLGHISNFRYIKGRALYTAAFTPPVGELEVTSDTILLCCQSPSNILQEATGKTLIAEAGGSSNAVSAAENVGPPVASRFTPNSPVGFSTTTDVGSQYGTTFDGFGSFATSTYMVPPGGNTRERGRGRGVLGGGFNGVSPNNHNVISYVEVQSGGIFKDFGDLTLARSYFPAGQTSSSTRGIFAGGYGGGGGYNRIDFITIASTGDAIDFGDISVAKFGQGGLSNQTRALFGGNSTSPFDNIIEFVTIATTGNAQDFGDIVEARGLLAGASSSTRGVLGGGRNNTPSNNTLKNTMEYVTFSTTGNTQDFGDLQALRYGHTGFSSPTRGIYAGGYLTPGQTATIDYFTIATLGNSLDFGNLTTNNGYCGSVTNSIRGAVTINDAPNYYNTIEYITIATLGDAQDFGDADVGSSKGHGDFPACASDSHGGIA